MAWPSRGRRESIIRDESFIFIGRTRGTGEEGVGFSIVPSTSRALCPSQGLKRSINLFSCRDYLFTLSHLLCRFLRRIEIFGCRERERERERERRGIRRPRRVRPCERIIVKRYSQIYSRIFSMIVHRLNPSR